MKEFDVTIEETISRVFRVSAEDIEDAEEITKDKYLNGEFNLIGADLSCKQMCIEDVETGKSTQWMEF